MAIVKKSVELETLLGQLTVEVNLDGKGICPENLSIKLSEFHTELPEGMHVKRCRAVIISLESTALEFTISYKASLSIGCQGGACTGQGLEAIEWQDKGVLLVVGTDDAEELARRLPSLNLANYNSTASYEEDAMEISLKVKPESRLTTFHLIVAENTSPELAQDSAWFAVNVSHKLVLHSL